MKALKSFVAYLLSLTLVFAVFFGAGAGLAFIYQSKVMAAAKNEENNSSVDVAEEKRTNILVLGVDKRPGDEHSRSDTMILASIDPELDKVALISIPRDTRVQVDGSPLDKICTANYVGGPEYAVEVVENFMNTTIDYYVEMDFNGFKDIIDTLGGVTVNVPQRMYKPTEDIDLNPGVQKLDGRQALAFVRYRDYAFGDIQRTSQQQEFLKALADEVLKPSTLTKLPQLAKQFDKYITTNLKVNDLLRMATWVPGFSADSIITQTLPGYFYDKYDDNDNLVQSYWIADGHNFNSMVEKLFAGETMVVYLESPNPPYVPSNLTEEDINQQRAALPSPGHES